MYRVTLAITIGVAAVATLSAVEGLRAQDVRDTRVQFEVASVRPNKSSSTAMSTSWNPNRSPAGVVTVGRFRATNLTLRMLITRAYDLRSPEQLRGAPSWIDSERFDIEGVPPSDLPWAQRLLLLQALLEDRFQLLVRPETADATVYVLVRERTDTPVPKGMRLSTVKCEGMSPTPGQPEAGPHPNCGTSANPRTGRINPTAGRMNGLAFMLATALGVRVLDRTGLAGQYDFDVVWPVENAAGVTPPADSIDRHAALISAVRDQIGLILRKETIQAPGVFIERIGPPTPN